MYIQLKIIKTKSRSRDYYIMMLKLSKMYLHVIAWLKCKIWEIQLRHQVLKCSDFISGTKPDDPEERSKS